MTKIIINSINVLVLGFTFGPNGFHTVCLKHILSFIFEVFLFFSSNTILTAPWYISTSLSPKYGICLKGLTDMSTGPMYVCVHRSRVKRLLVQGHYTFVPHLGSRIAK